MEAGRWRPGVKRRRFRNPLLLAAGVLLVVLLITYACANGVWRAVSGAASPSLLGVVSVSDREHRHYAMHSHFARTPSRGLIRHPDVTK